MGKTEISGCGWFCLRSWKSLFYPQGNYSFHPAVVGWVVFHLEAREWENEVCFAAQWSWLTCAVPLPEMQCDDSTNIQEKKPKDICASGQITAEKIQWTAFSHFSSNCILWLQPDTVCMENTLGGRHPQNMVFQWYNGLQMEKRLKKRKVFHVSKRMTGNESIDTVWQNTLWSVKIRGFCLRISLDRSSAISDFLQVSRIAK